MDVQKKMTVDMLHGSMAGPMVIFALPLALTGVLQQLFNTADTLVLGQFVGTDALAAVGNNAPIISLLVNLFIGISLGANVVIARFIGAHDLKETIRAVHTSFLLALLLGIFVAVLGELIARPMLELLAVPDSVMPAAELYLRIYFLGMPAIGLYNFESAIYRSRGNTWTPLKALAAASGLNIVLNLVTVLVFDWGVGGVAAATALSNYLSAASSGSNPAPSAWKSRTRRKSCASACLQAFRAWCLPCRISSFRRPSTALVRSSWQLRRRRSPSKLTFTCCSSPSARP